MTTQQAQLPEELRGIDVDAPNPNPDPALQGEAPQAKEADTGWHQMKCYNLSTGEFVGNLGTSQGYLTLVRDNGEPVNWSYVGSDLYLQRGGGASNRYLGVGTRSYACWGLWTPTGWVNAIVYNADHTISLASNPQIKLYGPYRYLGTDWVVWSDGTPNQNILRCEMNPFPSNP